MLNTTRQAGGEGEKSGRSMSRASSRLAIVWS
jgi:hypothetical protein